MTTERSDKLFEAGRDAQIKFDYFVLGIVGALCAFVGQSFTPTPLGINPSSLELMSLLLLVASVVGGFRRIESTISLMHLNRQYLRLLEEKGALVSNAESPIINRATGEIFSAEEVAARVAILEEFLPDAKVKMEDLSDSASRSYSIRNWLLLVGFLCLLLSRVWAAYV
jgi:hypothetical protein